MKVLGLDIIESFLAGFTDRQSCEVLTALVYELKHHQWVDANALACDYPQAELDNLPKVRFRLANNTLLIEGLIQFESGVLLLTKCLENTNNRSDSGDHSEWEAA